MFQRFLRNIFQSCAQNKINVQKLISYNVLWYNMRDISLDVHCMKDFVWTYSIGFEHSWALQTKDELRDKD